MESPDSGVIDKMVSAECILESERELRLEESD